MRKISIFIGIIFLLVIIVFFANSKFHFNISKNNINPILKNNYQSISTIVIPHHDLVKDKRADLIKNVAKTTKPRTIILISPNHFDTGSSDILTTNKIWQLADSTINPNKEKIDILLGNKLIISQESAFESEHGIKNILSDIHNNFPNAQIIPIIIKQKTTQKELDDFWESLNKIQDDDTVLIASVDFSHYQPGALAEIHDQSSIQALNNMDENLILKAEVDSPQSLYLAIKWAKLCGTNKFHLEENTNSGKIASARDAESTSYVFGYYQNGDLKPMNNEFTFIIGGDMMFDRLIDYKFPGNDLYKSMENLGERFFLGTDLSLVNNEGPISEQPIKPDIRTNNLVFNFPPKSVDVLNWLHINSVSLANNHSGNAGASGLAYTKELLTKNNINYIGQESDFNNESVKRYTQGDAKVSVIVVNLFAHEYDLTQTIKKEKNDGYFVIMFPHWGNEYQSIHSKTQENYAHSWINSGADLVIGSHPHVVQDAEIYNDKYIFYSLGNLLFDQTFSKETQQGLVISGVIKDQKLDHLVLLPTQQLNLKPQLMTGQAKTDIITKFRKYLNLSNSNLGYGYDIIK
jgi:poly-gamma-glutamate synthesis protein (capsule biosynthesis protein)